MLVTVCLPGTFEGKPRCTWAICRGGAFHRSSCKLTGCCDTWLDIRAARANRGDCSSFEQSWFYYLQRSGQDAKLRLSNTIKSIPAGLLTSSDSVVVARQTYGYKPLIFGYSMQRAAGATAGTGVHGLTRRPHEAPQPGGDPDAGRQYAARAEVLSGRTCPFSRAVPRAGAAPRGARGDPPPGRGQSLVVFAQTGHFHLCWLGRREASAEAWQG
jgi:hypothetical protein